MYIQDEIKLKINRNLYTEMKEERENIDRTLDNLLENMESWVCTNICPLGAATVHLHVFRNLRKGFLTSKEPGAL